MLVAESGQAAADVIEVMTSDPLETTTLSGQEAGDETRGAVAYAGLLLLYLAVLLYGNWMLAGVTEEKSNRVVEVLLSSVKPWQILAGKIIGIGLANSKGGKLRRWRGAEGPGARHRSKALPRGRQGWIRRRG